MSKHTIYHTVKDTADPDYIERNAPFKCTRSDAWLGHGYYFWESYIENAHWWGHECCSHYKNGYIICQASYHFDRNTCFDLLDTPENNTTLSKIRYVIETSGLLKGQITLSRIIDYMKSINQFPYSSVRLYEPRSKSLQSQHSDKISYSLSEKSHQYELCPPIQVCFYSKQAIDLSDFHIVYPEHYAEGYGV